MRQALGQLYRVRLGLWLFGFNHWRRSVKPVRAQMSGATVQQLLHGVARARRLVPQDTALIEALAAQRVLARHGHHSTVHVGIADNATLNAHAWLQCQGQVIVGWRPDLKNYPPLSK